MAFTTNFKTAVFPDLCYGLYMMAARGYEYPTSQIHNCMLSGGVEVVTSDIFCNARAMTANTLQVYCKDPSRVIGSSSGSELAAHINCSFGI